VPGSTDYLATRIYHPKNALKNNAPALVYFHGGGFVLGDIDSYDKLLTQLSAQSGVVICSVAYSLAPEAPFPQAINDAQIAFSWIVNNASQLGLNSARIAIGGDSAGANLAMACCLTNKKRNLPLPFFQLLIYPSVFGNNCTESRKLFAQGLFLTQQILDWFHDHYIPRKNDEDPRFNLLANNDFSSLPPAFILTAGFDPLRDEGEMLAKKLVKDGGCIRHSCYTDMFHGFMNFGKFKQSQNAVMECASILSEVMYMDTEIKENQ